MTTLNWSRIVANLKIVADNAWVTIIHWMTAKRYALVDQRSSPLYYNEVMGLEGPSRMYGGTRVASVSYFMSVIL